MAIFQLLTDKALPRVAQACIELVYYSVYFLNIKKMYFIEGFESSLKHFTIYLFFQINKKFKYFCLTFRSPLRKPFLVS